MSRRSVLRGAALGLGAAAFGPLATHTAAAQAAPPGGKTAIVVGTIFAGSTPTTTSRPCCRCTRWAS
ncbi:hypothetical protein BTZ20_1025 [Rhodococcus sp. MTM3W5.2]|nr:hypothetical protein BTZ20_1025 [Rhodococcus sp. MTM3W5.2]